MVREKRFELVIFDEKDNVEFIDRREFSELDKQYKKYNTPEELYESLKETYDNTHLILEKSSMKIVEIGTLKDLGDY